MDATYALRIDAMDLRPATRAAETRAVGDGGISGASDASSSRVCRPRMLARRGRVALNRTRPAIRAGPAGLEGFQQFGEGARGGFHVRRKAVAVVQQQQPRR